VSYLRLTTACLLLLLCVAPAAAQGEGASAGVARAAGLIREGKLDEAERQLAAVLKAAPAEAVALNLLGAIRAQQGRLDEAEALFTRAARADARFVGPHQNLAYLYHLRNQPEKTAAALREVLRREPANADAAHKLARLLLTLGRLEECIRFVEEARGRGQASPAMLSMLGDARLAQGELKGAEEAYGRALEGGGDAAALLGLAQVSLRRGDAPGAAAHLARAKVAAGDSPDLLYGYALVALRAGFDEEARGALARAVALRPGDERLLFLSGVSWLRGKKADLSEAEQSFRRFLELRPASAQGQLYLGYVLLKQKRSAEARPLLEASVKADPAAPEGFYYLGLIAQDENDEARAVGLLEDVTRRFPDFPHAHVALGVSYLRLKDYERARRSLEAGVKLDPADQKAHYNLALLYARLKEPQRAREEMRIVEELRAKSGASPGEEELLAPAPRP
jgi:Flp pilus assembly protein TadD